MVDITERVRQIKGMIDAGKYFAINCARQYGKTTILNALETYINDDYVAVNLDFQMLGYASFETEQMFVEAFSNELLEDVRDLPDEIRDRLEGFTNIGLEKCTLQNLFHVLSRWCRIAGKKIVLMIDEVDSATNNQVFLDFLAQIRGYYIKRNKKPTFQSVILAGVYAAQCLRLHPITGHNIFEMAIWIWI